MAGPSPQKMVWFAAVLTKPVSAMLLFFGIAQLNMTELHVFRMVIYRL